MELRWNSVIFRPARAGVAGKSDKSAESGAILSLLSLFWSGPEKVLYLLDSRQRAVQNWSEGGPECSPEVTFLVAEGDIPGLRENTTLPRVLPCPTVPACTTRYHPVLPAHPGYTASTPADVAAPAGTPGTAGYRSNTLGSDRAPGPG